MANQSETQKIVKPSAEGLANSLTAAARTATKKGPPPVHLWHPDFCGDLDMRIARDGTWYYLGSPIGRKALVKLFASILRKDGEDYFLVTPVEKVGIKVDDAPFLAVDFEVRGDGEDQVICFTTNVEDQAEAGEALPLRFTFDPASGEPAPYMRIRANLEALIDRKSFYRLVELGCHKQVDGQSWFGLWSGGVFFKMLPSSELPS